MHTKLGFHAVQVVVLTMPANPPLQRTVASVAPPGRTGVNP
jgi:hypothetical protein